MMYSRSHKSAWRIKGHGLSRIFGKGLVLIGVVALFWAPTTATAQAVRKTTPATNVQSVKSLLKETLAAMGGTALLQARDMTLSFTITSNTPQGNTSYVMKNEYARPDMIRQTTQFDFGEIILGYDGSAAWVKNPTGVDDLPAPQTEEMRSISLWILYDILQSIDKKEYDFDYVRSGTENGTKVHELSARHRTMKEAVRIFINDRTKLIVRKVARRQGADGLIDVEEHYSDYKTVRGVKVPFAITYQSGSFKVGDIVVKEVKINSGLSPALFQKPK